MKKLLAFVLTMLLLLPCLAAAASGVVRLTPVPTTNLSDLVLKPSQDEVKAYVSPSLKANIAGYIIVGGRQEVEVLSVSSDWCRVRFTSIYGDTFGWIPRNRFESKATPRPTIAPTPTPATGTAYVNNGASGRLNLRSQADASSSSKGKYYTGTPVRLTGRVVNGFAEVDIGDSANRFIGWMDQQYLTRNPWAYRDERPITQTDNPGGGVNLRTGPGTNYRKIGWYPHGTDVTVLGVRKDGWYHVTVNGQIGFMSASILRDNFPWEYGSDSDGISGGTLPVPGGAPVYIGSASAILRSGTGADAKALGIFYRGTCVTVSSYTRTGYADVLIGSQRGYIDMAELTSHKPAQTGMAYVVHNPYGTGLNLRETPSYSGRILDLHPNGTRVTLLGETGDWAYIMVGSQPGYVVRSRLATVGLGN